MVVAAKKQPKPLKILVGCRGCIAEKMQVSRLKPHTKPQPRAAVAVWQAGAVK